MEKIKEKLSTPLVQMIFFAVVILLGLVFIFETAKKDKEHNTPDMTDPRAEAVVTSVSSYSYEENGSLKELSDVTVDFYIEGVLHSNVSIYQIPFRVDLGDKLNIKYNEDHPDICSVVDDPEPSYSVTAYIFWTGVIVFGIAAFTLAARRSKLHEISRNVAEKNATQEEIDTVKQGYAGDGETADVNAAPFDNTIDYNQVYDENRGVMDSYFDPFATYGGYEEEGDSSDIDGNHF